MVNSMPDEELLFSPMALPSSLEHNFIDHEQYFSWGAAENTVGKSREREPQDLQARCVYRRP